MFSTSTELVTSWPCGLKRLVVAVVGPGFRAVRRGLATLALAIVPLLLGHELEGHDGLLRAHLGGVMQTALEEPSRRGGRYDDPQVTALDLEGHLRRRALLRVLSRPDDDQVGIEVVFPYRIDPASPDPQSASAQALDEGDDLPGGNEPLRQLVLGVPPDGIHVDLALADQTLAILLLNGEAAPVRLVHQGVDVRGHHVLRVREEL